MARGHPQHAGCRQHRRRPFRGRCALCRQKAIVRWIERGHRKEIMKVCADCENAIELALRRYGYQLEGLRQLLLF